MRHADPNRIVGQRLREAAALLEGKPPPAIPPEPGTPILHPGRTCPACGGDMSRCHGSMTICPACRRAQRQAAARTRRQYVQIKHTLVVRQRGLCMGCGQPLPEQYRGAHIDHIIPASMEKANDISNLQVLCARCNSQKHDRIAASDRFTRRQFWL